MLARFGCTIYPFFSFQIPYNIRNEKYYLTLHGSGGLDFTETAELHFNNQLFVMLQTDKPRYEAAQEGICVQLRWLLFTLSAIADTIANQFNLLFSSNFCQPDSEEHVCM